MVNQIILDYLKENRDKYPLESLKEKILSGGYTENDFNEALSAVSISKNVASQKQIDYSYKEISKGFKWMKLAGMIGMVFLFFVTVSIVFTFFVDLQNPSTLLSSISEGYILFIFFGVFFVMNLLYLFGFVRMGKLTKVDSLKNASRLRIIASILFVVFGVVISFIYKNLNNNLGLRVVDEITKATITLPSWTPIIFGIIFLFMIFVGYLFAIGLIKAGRDVRFARAAGITNLIVAILFTLAVLLGILSVFFPSIAGVLAFGLISLFFSKSWIYFAYLLSLGLYFLPRLFEVLSLMDASKKLEG